MKAPFLLFSCSILAGAAVATPALAQQAPEARPDPSENASRREIIVTATPFGHTSDETPAISARVDATQIRQTGGASLGDALQNVPGVAASGFAQGASRPIIRGMDANRVRLLENGTSISDVSDIGPDHGTPIDPLSARRIEVVRGAATLRYGSQAIGGVVNVLNDRVPTRLPDAPVAGELTGSFNTVNDGTEVAGLVDLRAGNVALHADGFHRDTGDYDTPLGPQTNSFFRGWGGSVGGSYFLGGGNSRIGLAVTHYDAQFGVPAEEAFIDMRQTKVMTRNVVELSGLLKSLNIDGSYGDYEHSEKEPDGAIGKTFRNKEWNLRAELLLNRIGAITNSALGMEYQHRDFSAFGEHSSYLDPAQAENIAGYLFTEVAVAGPLHVEASGRVEHVRISGTPASGTPTRREFTPVSGAVGLLLTAAPGVKFGLSASTTGRAPALTELFARGGHEGPLTFETGDPNLRIERANGLELSVRVDRGPFRFEGSVYGTWFRNYIYGDLTGRTCDEDGACVPGDAEELRELFYRQQGAYFRGVEAEAEFDLIRGDAGTLTARVMGDYTRATLDNGNNVPRIAPFRLGGGLDWTSRLVDAGVQYTRYGTQNRFGAFDTPTPGYDALGAHVTVRPFPQYPGVEFSIIGQNLTNDVQRFATAFNKDFVARPGRSVRFVARVATF